MPHARDAAAQDGSSLRVLSLEGTGLCIGSTNGNSGKLPTGPALKQVRRLRADRLVAVPNHRLLAFGTFGIGCFGSFHGIPLVVRREYQNSQSPLFANGRPV